jgi:hypothetical protein
MSETYFNVNSSLTGGFLVVYVQDRRPTQQAIFDTPRDVAAAARFMGASVVSHEDDIRAACRAAGVRLVVMDERR